jgi:hypothetical protein
MKKRCAPYDGALQICFVECCKTSNVGDRRPKCRCRHKSKIRSHHQLRHHVPSTGQSTDGLPCFTGAKTSSSSPSVSLLFSDVSVWAPPAPQGSKDSLTSMAQRFSAGARECRECVAARPRRTASSSYDEVTGWLAASFQRDGSSFSSAAVHGV